MKYDKIEDSMNLKEYLRFNDRLIPKLIGFYFENIET